MSKTKSKNILGIFSILIMMHHLGQRTSAFWLPDDIRRPGLEVFVPIGYLLVAFFFFCSGYGLIKSLQTKEDYMKGFLVKRLNRILLVFVITEIIYLVFRTLYAVLELPANPYSWFVYAIVVLYVGFFFIYRRKNKFSLILMTIWVIGYSVICYLLVKGNWWINATPAFLVGIYMAEHERTGEEKISTENEEKSPEKNTKKDPNKNPNKNKVFRIILSIVVLAICFVITESANKIFLMLHLNNYGAINFMVIILQIIASSAFSLAIFYIVSGMREEKQREKIPIYRKILSFYGDMTLEFYLIHGLFVQLFSHHFMNDTAMPVCYIKNVLLYVIVVFILSTISAFAIRKGEDFIGFLYEKADTFRRFCDDQIKYIIAVIALFIVITAAYGTYRHKHSADNADLVKKYQEEAITYVDVKGSKVATYMAGTGDYVVVLLGADTDCCPTLSLRPLANNLDDDFQVIIIDPPGKGYSQDTEDNRTSDYMADVIHETLEKTGKTENVILASNQISSLYCYKYIEKYPQDVVGYVGIDAIFPELGKHFFEGNYSSVEEYRWHVKRVSRMNLINQNLMQLTGYVRFQMPVFEYLFYGSGLKEYYPVMEEMFIKNYMKEAHLSEQENIYDNCMAVDAFKLPEDFHTMFILDNYIKSTDVYGINWRQQYKKMITNKDIQSIVIVDGDPNIAYYKPAVIAKKIGDFVGEYEK